MNFLEYQNANDFLEKNHMSLDEALVFLDNELKKLDKKGNRDESRNVNAIPRKTL